MVYERSNNINKMFRFVKRVFIATMTFAEMSKMLKCVSNLLKCVSMSNQECKVRLAVVNINSKESLFYPYSVLINKCSGSCNDINNPYAELCVFDVVKNMNIKVFNLMSRGNETYYVSWHEHKCR